MFLSHNKFRLILIFVSISGIAGLFVLEKTSAQKKIAINEISFEFVGTKILLEGKALNVFVKKNTLFFELENNGKAKIIKFNPSNSDLDLVFQEKFVKVTGRLEPLTGIPEIIAHKVEKIE